MSQAAYQPEERERRRRQLSEQAIQMARESHWDEAVAVNRELLTLMPHDTSTLNRLGKALSEVGQYSEAKRAYTEALEHDPANNIARKNLERISTLSDEPASDGRHAAERIDPRLFIEETGKTGFTMLVDLASREVIARLSAGDQVYFAPEGQVLYVTNAADERIGRVEPRLANRLIKFMTGGNKYAAGIADLSETEVRLLIRETFQHPSQFGKVSFPAHGASETIRAYTKDSMVRRDVDDGDDYGDDDDDGDDDGDDEAEESSETEFEEPEFISRDE
ncbi:MAG TPA: tetratricopeptide repeat protein [Ktedonobacterales bacterium]|nr:tetratricopeptide repeat protein [Ktedonobacterales bacterium]